MLSTDWICSVSNIQTVLVFYQSGTFLNPILWGPKGRKVTVMKFSLAHGNSKLAIFIASVAVSQHDISSMLNVSQWTTSLYSCLLLFSPLLSFLFCFTANICLVPTVELLVFEIVQSAFKVAFVEAYSIKKVGNGLCRPKGGQEQEEKGRDKPTNKIRQRNARLTFSCYRL